MALGAMAACAGDGPTAADPDCIRRTMRDVDTVLAIGTPPSDSASLEPKLPASDLVCVIRRP